MLNLSSQLLKLGLKNTFGKLLGEKIQIYCCKTFIYRNEQLNFFHFYIFGSVINLSVVTPCLFCDPFLLPTFLQKITICVINAICIENFLDCISINIFLNISKLIYRNKQICFPSILIGKIMIKIYLSYFEIQSFN